MPADKKILAQPGGGSAQAMSFAPAIQMPPESGLLGEVRLVAVGRGQ